MNVSCDRFHLAQLLKQILAFCHLPNVEYTNFSIEVNSPSKHFFLCLSKIMKKLFTDTCNHMDALGQSNPDQHIQLSFISESGGSHDP